MTMLVRRYSGIFILILGIGSPLLGKMKPIKKAGRLYGYTYYSSEDDTYEFMNSRKIIGWIKKLFFKKKKSNEQELLDLTPLLEPTQTIPISSSIEPKITWIGHASFLIQINGFNILTDPIFGDINALNDPFFWVCGKPVRLPSILVTKRAVAPGIQLEDLPPIDAVVLSHDHSDHTDADALMALAKEHKPYVFVPEGKRPLMKKFGFDEAHIIEKTWWGDKHLEIDGKHLTISCLPACHNSIRFSPLSYRESLWASWMISANGYTIYFAGDTKAGPHFAQIAKEFPYIDVALMPIGPTYQDENKCSECHVDVPESIEAFVQLKAQRFVPMHYGTFAWGNDHLYHPICRLPESWEARKDEFKNKQLVLLGQGHMLELTTD